MMPLGLPVDPEVYRMTAGASEGIASPGSESGYTLVVSSTAITATYVESPSIAAILDLSVITRETPESSTMSLIREAGVLISIAR